MKAAQKSIAAEIPTDLAIAVGEVVIRTGQLERIIMIAIARVKCERREDFLHLLGKYKGDTLKTLIKNAESEFGKSYNWFDAIALRALNERRHSIHDALLLELDGTQTWQANSNDRQHRQVNPQELHAMRDEATRLIDQIGEGSLKEKKI